MNIAHYRAVKGLSVVTLLLSAAPSVLWAQTAPSVAPTPVVGQAAPVPPPAGGATPQAIATDEADLAEVVVTGSRLGRAGFTAPTPVTVVSSDQLRDAAPESVAAGILQLPELRASNGPTNSVGGTSGAGAELINLRALGTQRTLVLVDGQRFVPSTSTGSVDVNLIPDALIQRVDIVTGGASAAYGSDAVAGVVNFILNKNFTGLSVGLQTGITVYGDDPEYKASLTFGTPFAGGMGHFIVSGEYFNDSGVGPVSDRPWTKAGYDYIPNGTTPNSFVIVPDTRISTATYGGLVTSGPDKGIAFNANGTPYQYNYGTLTSATNQVGGSGIDTSQLASLAESLHRDAFFSRLSYDFTSNFSVYAQGNYADSTTGYDEGYNPANSKILADNPYLPAVLQATGAPSYTIGRYEQDLGGVWIGSDTSVARAVVGANGSIGTWKLDAYYEYGQSVQQVAVHNDLIVPNYTAAVAAIVNPTTGAIVCNPSTVAKVGAASGCVPWDPFGEHAPTAAQSAYLLGTSSEQITLREDVASLSAHGEPFSLWAGPVSLATGFEYRRESLNQTSDPLSQAPDAVSGVPGVFKYGNYKPSSGAYDVKELFGEVLLPLLEDVPGAQSLDVNGAARATWYSTSGYVTTWKAGLSWKPVNDIRFRGTVSRDIRAPNLSELYVSGVQTALNVVDEPSGKPIPSTSFISYSEGNLGLKPEEADTLTGGFVLEPHWIPGLDISIDVYSINDKNAITTLGAQTEINYCAAGQTFYCGLEQRNSAGTLTGIDIVPINLASLKTNGIDFELGYHHGVLNGGNLTFRALATYVDKLTQTVAGSAPIQLAGDVAGGVSQPDSGVPHWRGTLQAVVDKGPFNIFVQERYVGGGSFYVSPTIAATLVPFNVPGVFYTDLRAAYRTDDRKLEFYGAITNLFNKAPPPDPFEFGLPQETNYALYDTLGMTFHIGVNFKY